MYSKGEIIVKKKQFKAESKKLLDMMINSIYTNKEIFLRELISNASDAIDKLYYRSLTDKKVNVKKKDLEIWIKPDKKARTLTITDNGIGMTEEELENNLGTIAKSGSELFKEGNTKEKDISIIGQFGVGFYSAFMVSDRVEVESKSIDSDQAMIWESSGADGYTIKEGSRKENGTTITLYLKENTEDNSYDEFLETYHLQQLVHKYSDYIRYPIKMMKNTKTSIPTNSMTMKNQFILFEVKSRDVVVIKPYSLFHRMHHTTITRKTMRKDFNFIRKAFSSWISVVNFYQIISVS